MSPAVDGGPDDGPVARGTSGGEGPKKRKNGGAGSDGSEPEGGRLHWRSQSGPLSSKLDCLGYISALFSLILTECETLLWFV